MDKRTWAPRRNKMSWRNPEEQMDFGAENFCNLDVPEGKTSIVETAIRHGQAERLQTKAIGERILHLLLMPL
jgi:hypothetical protein